MSLVCQFGMTATVTIAVSYSGDFYLYFRYRFGYRKYSRNFICNDGGWDGHSKITIIQHQPNGNNQNPNGHLMQYLYCACVVALLSASVDKAL